MIQRFFSNLSHHLVVLFIVFLALCAGLVSIILRQMMTSDSSDLPYPNNSMSEEKVKQFSSSEEFQSYLAESEKLSSRSMITTDQRQEMMPLESILPQSGDAGTNRVSQTNVQVAGIDEPDIVKTDGKHIYFSGEQYFYGDRMPIMIEDSIDRNIESIYPPQQQKDPTTILQAFPPDALEKIGSIAEQGELLYINDTLIVVSYNELISYNVSNPRIPVESWRISFDENVSYNAARLYGDQLYLVTQTWTSRLTPCPLPLFENAGVRTIIPCTDIYHPSHFVPVDSTYTLSKINTANGTVNENISFVGSSGSSIIYMSPRSLYLTYSYFADMTDFFFAFLSSEGKDLVSDSVLRRLEELNTYTISPDSKMIEFQKSWESYLTLVSDDERRRIENEFQNRMSDYMMKHARELETTGIVRFNRETLAIESTGSIPGHPLNQFSLDEYKGNLRIATTVSDGTWWNTEGAMNDVYILNDQLKQLGSITDLGLDEKIYSVRFIEDKGYLVTFRQTDPFYILDLSDPNNPRMTGQLKIPGFSSYLHPISENLILGVGQENNQVKLSMFDVSNLNNPVESDKYLLDEYWSDISNTHHAFLQDEKHRVFFIPGGQGGYIFAYDQSAGTMKLAKAVSMSQAKRALFLDDFLYVIGEQEIVILDETNWEKVNEMSL